MYSYIGYGLGIRSTLPLPELIDGEAVADVNVRLGRVDHLPSGVAVEGSYFRATTGETQLFWEDVGTIQVQGRTEIIADPVPGVEESLLRLVILGPVFAALLQQRKLLVLHASSVAIPGGAVAFLGGKGWGKSTLAAALYSRGWGIAADDVSAVHVGTGCPTVLPGFPQLKLWPDAAVSLGHALETLPRLHSQLGKRAHRVDRGFPQAPLSIRRIYVLARGMAQEIEPLRPQEAFVELVRHSYCVRLLQAGEASSHFLQCASLANNVTIRRLRTHQSLSMLPDLAGLVEEDIAHDV
ncbi:MAG: serine kinase [Candidatus Binatia bacterium]